MARVTRLLDAHDQLKESVPMISTTTVDRLIQLGRRRGGLVIDDIGQALPVNTMSTEELADVLARLEEAGISVEIDPALLTPHHRKVVLHEVKPAAEVSRRTATDAGRSGPASSIKNASLGASRTSPYNPSTFHHHFCLCSGVDLVSFSVGLLVFRLSKCQFVFSVAKLVTQDRLARRRNLASLSRANYDRCCTIPLAGWKRPSSPS